MTRNFKQLTTHGDIMYRYKSTVNHIHWCLQACVGTRLQNGQDQRHSWMYEAVAIEYRGTIRYKQQDIWKSEEEISGYAQFYDFFQAWKTSLTPGGDDEKLEQMIYLMPDRTDQRTSEKLIKDQQESDAYLQKDETEANPVYVEQNSLVQHVWSVPNRYQLPVAIHFATRGESNTWYRATEGIDAQKWSHAMPIMFVTAKPNVGNWEPPCELYRHDLRADLRTTGETIARNEKVSTRHKARMFTPDFSQVESSY